MAETLSIRLIGTLGLLLDAKRWARAAVAPLLDQLQALRFRFHPNRGCHQLAGEGCNKKRHLLAAVRYNEASQNLKPFEISIKDLVDIDRSPDWLYRQDRL